MRTFALLLIFATGAHATTVTKKFGRASLAYISLRDGQIRVAAELSPQDATAPTRFLNDFRSPELNLNAGFSRADRAHYGFGHLVAHDLFEFDNRVFAVVRDRIHPSVEYLQEITVHAGQPFTKFDYVSMVANAINLASIPNFYHLMPQLAADLTTVSVITIAAVNGFYVVVKNFMVDASARRAAGDRLLRVHGVERGEGGVTEMYISPAHAERADAMKLTEVARGPWCQTILGR